LRFEGIDGEGVNGKLWKTKLLCSKKLIGKEVNGEQRKVDVERLKTYEGIFNELKGPCLQVKEHMLSI